MNAGRPMKVPLHVLAMATTLLVIPTATSQARSAKKHVRSPIVKLYLVESQNDTFRRTPALTSRDFSSAAYEPGCGEFCSILVTVKKDAAKRLSELTARNLGKHFAVLVDGHVVARPEIKARLIGDAFELSDGFTEYDASNLVKRILDDTER